MKGRTQFFLRFFSIIFFLVISVCYASAQWYNPDKVNKKAASLYAQAYEEAVDAKYEASIPHLNVALLTDPKYLDVYLSRAGIYANMKNYISSVADYEKALALDYEYAQTYLLPYAISLAGVGKFNDALLNVNKFLEKKTLNEQSKKAGAFRQASFEFAINYNRTHQDSTYHFTPVNMGEAINSKYLEYFPSLTIEGNKIIFTRRVNNDEDFYEASRVDGTWQIASSVTGKINTNLNEGAQNISQDGQLLIFTGCNYPEGEGSCDLYVAQKNKAGNWSTPENLGRSINTEAWESSPSLSPDKKDLYFSSNRPGGFGGKDIWVSHKNNNGKWSLPENLGATVNTGADEGCPFIHADNQSLYFNSNGHLGYGLTDLFVVKKSGGNRWGSPLNLGYPVNTIDDEGSLIVTADGKTAIYASDGLDTKGGLDLYTFTLREEVRAAKILWVKGQVFDKKTGDGLPSAVELTDINNRNTTTKLQTDEYGNFLITLPLGKNYAFNVNRKGYLFYSDNFEMQNIIPDSPIVIKIPLQPIEKGAAVVLRNIFYDVNKAALKSQSLIELDKVVDLLTENPRLKIQINGYTDNVGKPADNLALSVARSIAVKTYLQSKGINAIRLSTKGFGETKPLETNGTEAGKAKNRRTEIIVSEF